MQYGTFRGGRVILGPTGEEIPHVWAREPEVPLMPGSVLEHEGDLFSVSVLIEEYGGRGYSFWAYVVKKE